MANIIRSHNTIQNRRMLFRSTASKRIFLVVALALALYGVMIANRFFNLEKYRYGVIGAITGAEKSSSEVAASGGGAVVADPNSPVPGEGATGLSASGTAPSSTNSAGDNASGSSSNPCGNATIPADACAAILSIEKNGAKDNPYVAVDTSQLPDGIIFTVDKTSWSQFSKELGAANATGTYNQDTYKLSLTFTLSSGTWRVTSYTLN